MKRIVRFTFEERLMEVVLIKLSDHSPMSNIYSSVSFACSDYSDHPDRERVGSVACQIVDQLFELKEVDGVRISSQVLGISVHRQRFWKDRQLNVEVVLRNALDVQEVVIVEGI